MARSALHISGIISLLMIGNYFEHCGTSIQYTIYISTFYILLLLENILQKDFLIFLVSALPSKNLNKYDIFEHGRIHIKKIGTGFLRKMRI